MSADSVTCVTQSGEHITFPVQFSRYRYIRTIGKGASSVVIQVRCLKTNGLFAAKIVPRNSLTDQKMYYFEQEVRVLQNISHPNIVKFEDIVYLSDLIILITECCNYGDVLDFITSPIGGRFEDIRSIFYQIVKAVDYLHTKGYAHRDLKPENVFVTDGLKVKVGDLGLASDLKRYKNQLTATICGTLFYTAPEIIEGTRYDPIKSDVWSLGIILYTMLTGFLPWQCADEADARKEIIRGIIEVPENITSIISDVLTQCLTREPDKRPTTSDLLEMPWMKLQESTYNAMFAEQEKLPLKRHSASYAKKLIKVNPVNVISKSQKIGYVFAQQAKNIMQNQRTSYRHSHKNLGFYGC